MVDKDDMQDEAYFQGQKLDTQASDGEKIIAATEDVDSGSTEETPREASSTKETGDQAAVVQETKPAIDFEKSYRELEKKYTKDSQRRSQIEKQYQADLQKFNQHKAMIDRIEQDQEAKNYLQQRWNGAKQVDPSIANDPLYGYLKPIVEKVQSFEQHMQQQQQQVQVQEANSFLDKQMDHASKEFEAMFGTKPGHEDVIAIYDYMAQNGSFNGKAAVRDIFFDKAMEAKSQKILENQQVKKNMGTTKVVNMNSSAAVSAKSNKSLNFRDAWKSAKEEAGA